MLRSKPGLAQLQPFEVLRNGVVHLAHGQIDIPQGVISWRHVGKRLDGCLQHSLGFVVSPQSVEEKAPVELDDAYCVVIACDDVSSELESLELSAFGFSIAAELAEGVAQAGEDSRNPRVVVW